MRQVFFVLVIFLILSGISASCFAQTDAERIALLERIYDQLSDDPITTDPSHPYHLEYLSAYNNANSILYTFYNLCNGDINDDMFYIVRSSMNTFFYPVLGVYDRLLATGFKFTIKVKLDIVQVDWSSIILQFLAAIGFVLASAIGFGLSIWGLSLIYRKFRGFASARS